MSQATLPSPSRSLSLPPSIRRLLGRLDRRLRAASAARGLGGALLAAALGAVVGMAADFAWPLPQAARWALWGVWLASTLALLVARVVWPLVRRQRALDLAAVAERSHPALRERLTGAVALLHEHHPISGSPALIAALADDADREAATIDARRAVPIGGALKRLALGVCVVGLVVAPGWFAPEYRTLGRRFLAPWADLNRVGRWVVTVGPGDKVVALGSDLKVTAGFTPRFGKHDPPETAWLEWTEAATGTRHRVAMAAEPESTPGFAVELPRVADSFTYRVVSDSAASPKYRVRAIEPPSVATVSALVEPPAYTKLPAALARDASRIDAWEGGRVRLSVTSKAPVHTMEVAWPGGSKERVPFQLTDGRTGVVTLKAEASGPYTLTLRDEYGLASRPEAPRKVVVRPDAPPVVATRGTENVKESRPDDVLRVAVAARDDLAVASVQLHYAVERTGTQAGPETGQRDLALPGIGTTAARGETTLALQALSLKPGDSLTYRVRVADNRPEPRGPNVTWSSPQSLTIVAQADPMLARRDRASRESLQAKLDALKKSAAENRKEAEQLRYAADAAQRGNGPWDKERQQALVQREAAARAVADQLQLFARDLEADARFRPLARPARQVAEVEAEAGRDMLDQARRADGPEARLNDLRLADARLGAVAERLDDLQRQFDAIGQRVADQQHLRDLADREDALARQAEELNEADRARLDRLQAEQLAVQKDLDALLQKSPELRADALDAEARAAEDLAAKARALAQKQREEARQAADLSKKAAALKALAEDQRAIEDDARRLALDVDTPLAENARGRLNTQAIKEPVAPIERGEIDQARQQLQGAESELRRLARDLEDMPQDPKALAQRLVRRQDALNGQIAEAAAEFQAKRTLTDEDKAALAAKLKPLAERQDAIARLANPDNFKSQMPDGKAQTAEAAHKSTNQAAERLHEAADPRAIRDQQQAARRDLARLADALPDHWRRQAPAREQLDKARRLAHEAARALEDRLRDKKKANDLADAARKQAQAAEAIAAVEPDARALPQRDRAAQKAKALADALQQGDRQALPALQVEARAALERLDQKMNGQVPADDLAAELAAEPPPQNADDQRRLATALRNLQVPDAAQLQAEAVRQAEHPEPGTPHPAAALARQLNGAPAEPPRQAQAPAPADPDLLLKPDQAARAQALARRERQVRERLQALLGERVPQQQALRDEAANLGREAAALRDQSRPISDRGQGPAHEAANLLGEQAPRAMDQGAEHLSQGQPAPAREDQRRAAELVERGAQQIDDFVAALRAERPAEDQAHPQGAAEAPLGEAREAAREATRQLDQARDPGQAPAHTQAAGQALRQAAQGLRAAAQARQGDDPGHDPGAEADAALAGQNPPHPGEPHGPTKDPHSEPPGAAAPDLAALQEAIRRKTGRSWGELPGHLRTEILQMSQGRYRDDYARLIQLYFREIAAGAGRETAKP